MNIKVLHGPQHHLTSAMFRRFVTVCNSSFRQFKRVPTFNSSHKWQLKPLLATGIAVGTVSVGTASVIALDASLAFPSDTTVSVDSSISPFPTSLSPEVNPNLTQLFSLLGHGLRYVTFLKFKVYGIGVYIASADINKARAVIQDAVKSLPECLSDPEGSTAVVQKLLDAKVQFAVRICPVRNTDYSHLKDGLIKSTLAHPLSKQHRDAVGEGLDELRKVFLGRKGSVPKNHLLYLEVLKDGSLLVSYENPKEATVVPMGTVKEPLVGQILMLQYLSGRKPLSEELRASCRDKMVVL